MPRVSSHFKLGRTQATLVIDCDGVIVDNTLFENRVTKSLVDKLANSRGVTSAAAHALGMMIWLQRKRIGAGTTTALTAHT